MKVVLHLRVLHVCIMTNTCKAWSDIDKKNCAFPKQAIFLICMLFGNNHQLDHVCFMSLGEHWQIFHMNETLNPMYLL